MTNILIRSSDQLKNNYLRNFYFCWPLNTFKSARIGIQKHHPPTSSVGIQVDSGIPISSTKHNQILFNEEPSFMSNIDIGYNQHKSKIEPNEKINNTTEKTFSILDGKMDIKVNISINYPENNGINELANDNQDFQFKEIKLIDDSDNKSFNLSKDNNFICDNGAIQVFENFTDDENYEIDKDMDFVTKDDDIPISPSTSSYTSTYTSSNSCHSSKTSLKSSDLDLITSDQEETMN